MPSSSMSSSYSSVLYVKSLSFSRAAIARGSVSEFMSKNASFGARHFGFGHVKSSGNMTPSRPRAGKVTELHFSHWYSLVSSSSALFFTT